MKSFSLSVLFLLATLYAVFGGCRKIVDEAQYHHHEFVNNSGRGISITKYQQGSSRIFSLANGQTFSQWIELNSGAKSDDILIVYGDSAKIGFDGGGFARYSVFDTSSFNFLAESNFVLQSVDKKAHRSYYVYTFTEDDYRATNR